MSKPDGGPAFPRADGGYSATQEGMSLRDYFAAHAPAPTVEWIKMQMDHDAALNPHGDTYKPQRRSRSQIVAGWKFDYADEMLKARK